MSDSRVMSLADMAPTAYFGLQADKRADEVPAEHQTWSGPKEKSLSHLQTCRQTKQSEPSSRAQATDPRAASLPADGQGPATANKSLGQQGSLDDGISPCKHDWPPDWLVAPRGKQHPRETSLQHLRHRPQTKAHMTQGHQQSQLQPNDI